MLHSYLLLCSWQSEYQFSLYKYIYLLPVEGRASELYVVQSVAYIYLWFCKLRYPKRFRTIHVDLVIVPYDPGTDQAFACVLKILILLNVRSNLV